MSDFLSTGTLPDEYQQLAKTVRDFAQSVVAPVAAQHDAEHSFPYEVVSGMADMGLFGLPFPEEFGGMGGDYFALCLALEELAKVDSDITLYLTTRFQYGATRPDEVKAALIKRWSAFRKCPCNKLMSDCEKHR